jgi:hypothetical protein
MVVGPHCSLYRPPAAGTAGSEALTYNQLRTFVTALLVSCGKSGRGDPLDTVPGSVILLVYPEVLAMVQTWNATSGAKKTGVDRFVKDSKLCTVELLHRLLECGLAHDGNCPVWPGIRPPGRPAADLSLDVLRAARLELTRGDVEAAVERLPPDVREHNVSRAAFEKLRVLLGVSGRS